MFTCVPCIVCLVYQALKRASPMGQRTDILHGLFWSAYDLSFPEFSRYTPKILEAFLASSANIFITYPSQET